MTHLSLSPSLQWIINGETTHPGSPAEGLLLNVRMVNAVFEDTKRLEFSPVTNTERFIAQIPHYSRKGVRAFTVSLQGGMPGYEGAVNSAFRQDGSLKSDYMQRVHRVIDACDRHGTAVILSCFYQRQFHVFPTPEITRMAVQNTARWIQTAGYKNVLLEIANEYRHHGFRSEWFCSEAGQMALLQAAKAVHPTLLVSTSGMGDGRISPAIAEAVDYITIHLNQTPVESYAERFQELKKYKKAILCNEDDKTGSLGAKALAECVQNHVSWGFMAEKVNQHFPFAYRGENDDPSVYQQMQELATQKPPNDKSVPRKVYLEKEGVLMLEAENGYQEGWQVVSSPITASGSVVQAVAQEARLTFQVEIKQAGRWYLWLRTYAPDSANNGLFLEWNGKPLVAPSDHLYAGVRDVYLLKSSKQFHWKPEWQGPGEGNHRGPITIDVERAGRYSLSLVRRKTETPLLDRVALTLDPAPSWINLSQELGPPESATV